MAKCSVEHPNRTGNNTLKKISEPCDVVERDWWKFQGLVEGFGFHEAKMS